MHSHTKCHQDCTRNTRAAAETQTSKAQKKGNVKVETESIKQNIEQKAQRRKNNQRNGFNMPQVRGKQRETKANTGRERS